MTSMAMQQAPTSSAPRGRLSAASGALGGRARDAAFLCLHSVADGGPPFLSIPPDRFAAQLRGLRDGGWASGGSAELARLGRGERLERPHVFLTFDDGYLDNHTHAWPLLREHGFGGIVFLLTDLVGGALRWPEVEDAVAASPDVMRAMDWNQIGELAEAGIEFGSHGRAHAHLNRLGDEELAQELLDSRRIIIERLGRCDVLAYPFGHWDLRVALAAGRAGYAFAFALAPVPAGLSTPLSIPRVCVDHRDVGWRLGFKTGAPGRRLLSMPSLISLRHALRH